MNIVLVDTPIPVATPLGGGYILYKRLIVEYNQMQDYIDTYCNNNKFN